MPCMLELTNTHMLSIPAIDNCCNINKSENRQKLYAFLTSVRSSVSQQRMLAACPLTFVGRLVFNIINMGVLDLPL